MKNSYQKDIIGKFVLIFVILYIMAAFYSCSDSDAPLFPVNNICDVKTESILSSLPCSVFYYANVNGNVTETSITYYDDSGKHIIAEPVFPFQKSLLANFIDTLFISGKTTVNPGGGIIVSLTARRQGYIFESRDSCFK